MEGYKVNIMSMSEANTYYMSVKKKERDGILYSGILYSALIIWNRKKSKLIWKKPIVIEMNFDDIELESLIKEKMNEEKII